MPSPTPEIEMEILSAAVKMSPKAEIDSPPRSAPPNMKTRARIKHPVNNYPRKHFPASNIYQIPDPFKLYLFDNFCNCNAFDTALTQN